MTTAKKQQNAKPKIDEVVSDILHDKNLENALDLISFIKESKISLRWASTHCWQLYYKSQRIGLIRMSEKAYPMYRLRENAWLFAPWGLDDVLNTEAATNDKTKEIIWNSVLLCNNCGSCGPGRDFTFHGKTFEKACQGGRMHMANPDKDTLECIKRLLRAKKKQLDNPAV